MAARAAASKALGADKKVTVVRVGGPKRKRTPEEIEREIAEILDEDGADC